MEAKWVDVRMGMKVLRVVASRKGRRERESTAGCVVVRGNAYSATAECIQRCGIEKLVMANR
jgi:hypothetical protein